MTTVEEVLNPAQPKLEPKRNQWGQYLLPHPDTGQEMAFQRATTLAKMLGDTYALDMWHRRMVAKGITMRPDLFAQAAAATLDEKALLNQLCEQAAETAGATEGRNKGSALHRFAQRVDEGDTTVVIPPPFDRDIAAYRRAMAEANVTPVAGHAERIVVVPSIGVAGTFDRLLQSPGWQLPRVGDLKTAQKIYDFLEIAIQLAIYSRGVAIWDLATQAYLPMPAVDQDLAVVMHLPAGSGECTLLEIDVAVGWEATLKAVEVRDWRKRKGLASVMSAATVPQPVVEAGEQGAAGGALAAPNPVPGHVVSNLQRRVQALDDTGRLALSVELATRGLPKLSECPGDRIPEWVQAVNAIDGGRLGTAMVTPDTQSIRDALAARVQALDAAGVERLRDRLAKHGLRGVSATPDARLDAWAQVLATVETEELVVDDPDDPFAGLPHALPSTPGPIPAGPERVGEEPSPPTAPPTTTPARPPVDITDLKTRYAALPEDLRCQVDAARAGTILEGKGLAFRGTPDEVAVAEQLIAVGEADAQARRAQIAGLLDGLDDDMCTVLLDGADPAAMTVEQVGRLAALTVAVDRLVVAFTYGDDGPLLMSTDAALPALTEVHGTKANVLAVGREVAKAIGHTPAPRSALDIAGDPVLAALTLDLKTAS